MVVVTLPSSIRDVSVLVNEAERINSQGFFHLVTDIVQLMVDERSKAGRFRITGRLVKVPSMGEAIIVGDLHGDLESLIYILENTRFIKKAEAGKNISMIFLGDYGDRGVQSPEVYYIVLKLKATFPKHIILMRGNHEGPDDLLAYPHDLPVHLEKKFGDNGLKAYRMVRKLFSHLYSGVLVEGKFALLHGGAPSQASRIEDLAFAHAKHPHATHLEEILWSDPIEGVTGTYSSPRGAGKLFGEDITDNLLKLLAAKMMIRGHEPSKEGFKINHGGKVLTLFSRKGPPYYNSYGAYLHLDLSREIRNTQYLLEDIHKF